MTNIGRGVIISAESGTIISEEVNKRGQTSFLVKMDDGRQKKVDARYIEFADKQFFAPQRGKFGMVDVSPRDFYGDKERMSARWTFVD